LFYKDSSKFLRESLICSPLRQLTHLALLGVKNSGPSSVKVVAWLHDHSDCRSAIQRRRMTIWPQPWFIQHTAVPKTD